MNQLAQAPGATLLFAQITRADGTVGRKRLVGYSHPNPLRRGAVRLLMKIGVL
jgi:hypothetical protein